MTPADFHLSARAICRDRGWDYADVFRHQFRLTRDPASPCAGWGDLAAGAWHLHHCPGLPTARRSFARGRGAIALLGVAVDAEGALVTGEAALTACTSVAAAERWIEGLAGRFVALLTRGKTERLYLDPTGGMPVVYDPVARCASSSIHCLADRDIDPLPEPSLKPILNGRRSLLMDETADARVRRAPAGHALDLTDFTEQRHWPRDEDDFDDHETDPDEAGAEIAERLRAIMFALTGGFRCSLPVSGGMDSRILLSATTGFLDRVAHFFLHDIRWITGFDADIAIWLARHLAVPMLVLDRRAPRFKNFATADQIADLRDKMTVRTSLTFTGIDDRAVRATELAPDADLLLRGNIVEMTRANKWTMPIMKSGVVTDEQGLAILAKTDPEALKAGLSAPRYDRLIARYAGWRAGLPGNAGGRVLDLAHCELFLPAAPNQAYYATTRQVYLNPFNDRRLIRLTASVAPQKRKALALVGAILAADPLKLGDIPFTRDILRERKQQK